MDAVTAYVLHARPWRESSQLVELLTAEHGRIGVVARGSRGTRRANPLQPFCLYCIELGGRGELRRAQSVEAAGAPLLLAGKPLFASLYANELLVRLLWRDVPVPGVFALYARLLATLAAGAPLEPALRAFEKCLLDDLGYGHRYAETVDGEPVRTGARYTFDPGAGVREALPGTPDALAYDGSVLLALEAERLDTPGHLRDAKRLMRAALAAHLGDRPLASRELFRPSRAASGSPDDDARDTE